MKLLDTEYKEIEAYMKRKSDIVQIARKLDGGYILSDIEKEAAKNYYSNLVSLEKIKGLDKVTREDIQAILSILEGYVRPQKEKIDNIKETARVEEKSSDKGIVAVKTLNNINIHAVSPIKYYVAQVLPRLIAVGAAYGLLLVMDTFVNTGALASDSQVVAEAIQLYSSLVGIIGRLLLYISFVILNITTVLDIMYIMLPYTRELLKQFKLVSSIADIAVLQGEY